MDNQKTKLVDRSQAMIVAAYYLSRCGDKTTGRKAAPPTALAVSSWKEAYGVFFDSMGDGRELGQFRNSLKNARDVFDVLFPNGRVGWKDARGHQPEFAGSFLRVHEQWQDRSDEELESFVLGLMVGLPSTSPRIELEHFAKTEGGKKVYLSTRSERKDSLRADAIEIHGSDCMACGFSFEEKYGGIGKGFAEVHHMIPLADFGVRETDPLRDLAVLCANCHRMVHRTKGTCLSLDELKDHLKVSIKHAPLHPPKAKEDSNLEESS